MNATYASVNQILNLLEAPPFNIKYELCEIILCKVSENLEHTGLTVMDGPFFSVMPYGNTGYHSLTSVTFTPHYTSLGRYYHHLIVKESQIQCAMEIINWETVIYVRQDLKVHGITCISWQGNM